MPLGLLDLILVTRGCGANVVEYLESRVVYCSTLKSLNPTTD